MIEGLEGRQLLSASGVGMHVTAPVDQQNALMLPAIQAAREGAKVQANTQTNTSNATLGSVTPRLLLPAV